jgi:hypothetical protein
MRYGGPGSSGAPAFNTLTATWVFDVINNPKNNCDEDKDGTPNQKDLDSDGDGCPDAVEGGAIALANYTAGMNTVAGPFGLNGFADALETGAESGIPKFTVKYSTYATDSTKKFCDDNDGDLVSDHEDLDDDNDGIQDAVECPSYADQYKCKVSRPDNLLPDPTFSAFNPTTGWVNYSWLSDYAQFNTLQAVVFSNIISLRYRAHVQEAIM